MVQLKKVKLNSKRVFAGQDGIKVGATANIEPSNSKGDCDTNRDGTFDRKILRLELSFFGSNQYVSGGCGHTICFRRVRAYLKEKQHRPCVYSSADISGMPFWNLCYHLASGTSSTTSLVRSVVNSSTTCFVFASNCGQLSQACQYPHESLPPSINYLKPSFRIGSIHPGAPFSACTIWGEKDEENGRSFHSQAAAMSQSPISFRSSPRFKVSPVPSWPRELAPQHFTWFQPHLHKQNSLKPRDELCMDRNILYHTVFGRGEHPFINYFGVHQDTGLLTHSQGFVFEEFWRIVWGHWSPQINTSPPPLRWSAARSCDRIRWWCSAQLRPARPSPGNSGCIGTQGWRQCWAETSWVLLKTWGTPKQFKIPSQLHRICLNDFVVSPL